MFRAILGGLLEGLKECVSGLKFLVPGPDSRLSEVEKIIWWRGFGKSIGVYSPWVLFWGGIITLTWLPFLLTVT